MDTHLNERRGIQIGPQRVARNTRHAFNLEYPLCRRLTSRNPSRDGALNGAKLASESGLAAGLLAGEKNGCVVDSGGINRGAVHNAITAQIGNCVNACNDNGVSHAPSVAKRAETDPSEFWKRLTEAWARKGLPTSQNGIAMHLKMSQGSTHRWYTGQGYPEIDVLRELARLGGVTVDWLLDERLPKSPIGKQTTLGKFLLDWEQLDEAGKERVHRATLGELALTPTARVQPSKKSGT